jgi:hypothetical protein
MISLSLSCSFWCDMIGKATDQIFLYIISGHIYLIPQDLQNMKWPITRLLTILSCTIQSGEGMASQEGNLQNCSFALTAQPPTPRIETTTTMSD